MKKITFIVLIVFTTITFQGQNKLLSSIDQYYNGSSWQTRSGYNYEYDSNNNLTFEKYYDYDASTGLWRMSESANYIYNTNNKVIQSTVESWDTATNKLENSYRIISTYNGGKFKESLEQEWDSSSLTWVIVWKNVMSYNSNNLPDSVVSYSWDGVRWINEYRGNLTYNSSNKIISAVNEKWDNAQWVNWTKTLLTYDANNKILTYRNAEWDDFDTIFKENERTDYVLDGAGNRISETTVYTDNNMPNRSKKEYIYDSSSLMSSFANPFRDKTGFDYIFEDFPHVNKPLSYNDFSYDNVTSTYANRNRTIYDYTNSIVLFTEQFETVNNTITIFPNPTQDLLNIELVAFSPATQITISDMLGKKLYSHKVESTKTVVNISGYTKGIYLVAIMDGNKKGVKKLIID
ncbi:hypothetical protein RCH18_001463 [Flavobacterium sp. PL11]|uniref:T9SS type A sorting domain-containing protein n=1 Tax=Flavobacterium sp. PL11 TaxID=3071717 RepID=UPI002E0C314A|nr:hypothetical protein [Flavobacterium sp. PL11]